MATRAASMSARASGARRPAERGQRPRDLAGELPAVGADERGAAPAAVKERAGPRQPGERPRCAWRPEAPADRKREALEQTIARIVGEGRPVEQLDEELEVGEPPPALRQPEPPPPAEPALVAHRILLGALGEQGQGLLQQLLLDELPPQDVHVAREASAEPARHRQPERVVKCRARDARVMKLPLRRTQRLHSGGKSRQALVHPREHAGVVGIGLQEAERLVQLTEDAWLPDRR